MIFNRTLMYRVQPPQPLLEFVAKNILIPSFYTHPPFSEKKEQIIDRPKGRPENCQKGGILFEDPNVSPPPDQDLPQEVAGFAVRPRMS
jgi:hypothetical protein